MKEQGPPPYTNVPTHMGDLAEVIKNMQRQESTSYRRSDYLRDVQRSTVVDSTWRQRIVEWMHGVVDHCGLRRDSVAVAAYYLDLCVERGVIESRQHFQLAAMTALQLAIKLYDSTVVKLDSMIKLGRGLFTEQDVLNMETKMLAALQWKVHPPTPTCFLRQFLCLLPSDVSPTARYMIAEVTRFISEISVCLYKFVDCPSSVVAFAAMLISMERIDEATLPTWQRQQIFHLMKAIANLDQDCMEIQGARERLQAALERNVSIDDLMQTILAQCRAEGVAVAFSANSIEAPKHQGFFGVHSPREVTRPTQA